MLPEHDLSLVPTYDDDLDDGFLDHILRGMNTLERRFGPQSLARTADSKEVRPGGRKVDHGGKSKGKNLTTASGRPVRSRRLFGDSSDEDSDEERRQRNTDKVI